MKRLLAIGLLAATAAFAKVGDPPPAEDAEMLYRSHANAVEAVRKRDAKVLWRVELFQDVAPTRPDPKKEADVQWTLVVRLVLRGPFLEVDDSKGRHYRIEKKTGRVLGRPAAR